MFDHSPSIHPYLCNTKNEVNERIIMCQGQQKWCRTVLISNKSSHFVLYILSSVDRDFHINSGVDLRGVVWLNPLCLSNAYKKYQIVIFNDHIGQSPMKKL